MDIKSIKTRLKQMLAKDGRTMVQDFENVSKEAINLSLQQYTKFNSNDIIQNILSYSNHTKNNPEISQQDNYLWPQKWTIGGCYFDQSCTDFDLCSEFIQKM